MIAAVIYFYTLTLVTNMILLQLFLALLLATFQNSHFKEQRDDSEIAGLQKLKSTILQSLHQLRNFFAQVFKELFKIKVAINDINAKVESDGSSKESSFHLES